MMAKKKATRRKAAKKKVAINLDLNGDGVFDAKDKSIAAKALATKIDKDVPAKSVRVPVKEPVKKSKSKPSEKSVRYIAIRDINLQYRKGSIVPGDIVSQWEKVGFEVDKMVKRGEEK